MTIFEFEVQCSQKVRVEGFSISARDMARVWLIDNLKEECEEILDNAVISNGEVVEND